MEEDLDPLHPRLQGIADALTVRIATLIATELKGVRLTPDAMDEIRHWVGVSTRGAALEGARNAGKTLRELLPVPKAARAVVQEMKVTRFDTKQGMPPVVPPPPPPKRKLPGGI